MTVAALYVETNGTRRGPALARGLHVSIPKQASVWDERRNTSQVIAPPPNVVPDALRALAHFRETDPARVQWIEEGAPTLTEAEHLERFGEPYNKPNRRKAAPAS